MKSAGDFLSKFNNLKPPNDAIRKAVANAVRDAAGVPVATKDVKIAHGVAFIECSSIAKSAIRAKRGPILDELYQMIPKARESVRDIR